MFTDFALAKRQPGLVGIVLEMDVLNAVRNNQLHNRIRHIQNGVLAEVYDASYERGVNPVVDFHKDVPSALPTPITGPRWFIPAVFNQGGYDCVQLRRQDNRWVLRFFQVTRSPRHVIKLWYMRTFLASFNEQLPNDEKVSEIDIVAVVPSNAALSYQPTAQWDVIGAFRPTRAAGDPPVGTPDNPTVNRFIASFLRSRSRRIFD